MSSSSENRHPIDVVPPSPVGSPADLAHLSFGGDVPFWKPTWGDIFRQLGWRWLLLLIPILLLICLILLIPLWPESLQFLVIGWKLVLLVIVLSFGVIGRGMQRVMALRKEPFCIHCGYDLTGLPDGHTCPECGRQFWFNVIEEYRRAPNWFIQRYRMRDLTRPTDVPFAAGKVRRKKSRDGT
ncbi:MAG TPA: hypothetical protein VMD30_13020 [Tepidisphaeraceae bacterium]|nr:hypothetical protein [Tepidisphaeraceae bacterium]